MNRSVFATPPPGSTLRAKVVHEIIVLVSVAVLLGVVWFAGNHLIAYYYRPKLQKVQASVDVLKKERAGLYAQLHKQKVRLFIKVFTERYDPKTEDILAEEQLMRIYNRFGADDTRFLTYLFKTGIKGYSYNLHKDEIDALEKDLSDEVQVMTDRAMRPYKSGRRQIDAIRDEWFQALYRAYWFHNISLA